MSKQGSLQYGLLHDLHADRCDGTEYSACRPVVYSPKDQPGDEWHVLYMAWCGECGAADWDFV